MIEGPKVSIIVPAYNVKDYIERTIESICKQTYKNIEIIIVDDGSTDGTKEVVEEILKKDTRISAYFKRNEGVTRARLYGVEKAHGDWIGFVDADDLISSDMYETLLSNALKYNADISHCGYKMVFPNREVLYYDTKNFIEQDTAKGLKDLLEGNFVEPGLWNKLFKKELFKELTDKMDASIKNLEDLLMNFYLFEQSSKAIFFDKCLYFYMLRKNSATTGKTTLQKISDPLKVLKIIKAKIYDDRQLKEIIDKRIIGNLLQILKTARKDCPIGGWEYCKMARCELKEMLPQMKKENMPRKIKIQAFLAVYFPCGYRVVHAINGWMKGNTKKYCVE